MKQEQLKVRKSKLSEDEILQIAEVLKDKYCSFAEIKRMARHYGMRGGIESILSLFNVRGYLVTEETLKIYDVHCKRFMKKNCL